VTSASRSLTDGLGTTSPGGWLLVHVLGSPPRRPGPDPRAHMAGSPAHAPRIGRWTAPEAAGPSGDSARQMHASGEHTISAIADILGVARFTVYRALGWDGDTGRVFRSGSEQARWMRFGAATVPC
jgi:hypothetical protein